MTLRKKLIASFLICFLFTIIRQAFDFMGHLWLPILVNFLHILFLIYGLFGSVQRRTIFLLICALWFLVWFGWNGFLICFYANVNKLERKGLLLSFGMKGARSFWYDHNPLCALVYNATIHEWLPTSDCLMPHFWIEITVAAFTILFAFIPFLFIVQILVQYGFHWPRQPAASKQLSHRPSVTLELSDTVSTKNLSNAGQNLPVKPLPLVTSMTSLSPENDRYSTAATLELVNGNRVALGHGRPRSRSMQKSSKMLKRGRKTRSISPNSHRSGRSSKRKPDVCGNAVRNNGVFRQGQIFDSTSNFFASDNMELIGRRLAVQEEPMILNYQMSPNRNYRKRQIVPPAAEFASDVNASVKTDSQVLTSPPITSLVSFDPKSNNIFIRYHEHCTHSAELLNQSTTDAGISTSSDPSTESVHFLNSYEADEEIEFDESWDTGPSSTATVQYPYEDRDGNEYQNHSNTAEYIDQLGETQHGSYSEQNLQNLDAPRLVPIRNGILMEVESDHSSQPLHGHENQVHQGVVYSKVSETNIDDFDDENVPVINPRSLLV